MAGVHWLKRRTHLERGLRVLEIMTFVIVAATLLGGVVLFAWLQVQVAADGDAAVSAQNRLVGLLMLIGGFALLLIFPIVWSATRALRRKIGVAGQKIHVRLNDGRELVLSTSRMAYTRRALLYGPYSFPLRNQQGRSFYAEGELETWLEPLLQQADFLNPWQGLRHQWKNRDSTLLWPLASVAMLLALLAMIGLVQELYPRP
jgi:hypothetical protein